ncbi:MAG: FHA domain-containing protein [Armatimonadetes bacterium]|jgi:hypothetical protein|nr:FHA domain-containing protein [Armatimonadota bacterium]
MPYLVGLTGPYTGQAFEVKPGRTTVGRGPGCDLVLDADPAISRAHALLVSAGGVVQVQDAGSTHGVFVNGHPVAQGLLRTGDCVQFGGSAFLVQPVPAQVSEPPRLKVILPRSSAPNAPAVAVQDEPIAAGLGCLYLLVALLFPIPFGLLLSRIYFRRGHPANQKFAAACLLLSLVSLVLQVLLAVLLVRHLLQFTRPLADPWGDLGF